MKKPQKQETKVHGHSYCPECMKKGSNDTLDLIDQWLPDEEEIKTLLNNTACEEGKKNWTPCLECVDLVAKAIAERLGK